MTEEYADKEKLRTQRCDCGLLIEGVWTLQKFFVEFMLHKVQACPLISKDRANKIMAMVHRDNLGEFDQK
jgi:hypothetical protein